jgi:hypothetical protein
MAGTAKLIAGLRDEIRDLQQRYDNLKDVAAANTLLLDRLEDEFKALKATQPQLAAWLIAILEGKVDA